MHALKGDKQDSPAWDSFSSVKLFDEMKHNEQLKWEKVRLSDIHCSCKLTIINKTILHFWHTSSLFLEYL